TRAIIPVHLFGQMVQIDEIVQIAREHDIAVVEDAAQAIGAAYQDRPAGSWGTAGCFSFYPTKNLGGMGDGGMLTTNDAALADRLRLFASHGMRPRYYHQVIGINSRLDTFQAAVLRVKLQHLETIVRGRQQNAKRYDRLFNDAGLAGESLVLPYQDPDALHVWNQYAIRIPGGRRDALKSYLAERKVGAEIYYPIPVHMQECYQHLGVKEGSLPVTERVATEVLNLPIFPELRAEEQQYVVDTIAAFFAAESRIAA
ncbi:MAG: DegT/DnrJ/EryC1/StrS family aminotransferase, partial [Planctomycetota bacterium]